MHMPLHFISCSPPSNNTTTTHSSSPNHNTKSSSSSKNLFFLTTLLTLLLLTPASAQFREGDIRYEQRFVEGSTVLQSSLDSHPDVNPFANPASLYNDINIYRTKIPATQDYSIGVMVNPCGSNSTIEGFESLGYDCCNGRFGSGEYGYLNDVAVETYGLGYPSFRTRRSDPLIPANDKEILDNILLVDSFNTQISSLTSRRADDELVLADECVTSNDPFPYCAGFRLRKQKFLQMAACTDNNQTVSSLLPCYTRDGVLSPSCMQVSYTQSAFIHVCNTESERFGNDDHCGTFIEIHRATGSPYDDEDVVLSSVKLEERRTSGMVTTTIPLTYKFDDTKVLCDYTESVLRVGASVLVLPSDTCCCPETYNTLNKVGAYMCPKKLGTRHGPFASSDESLEDLMNLETQSLIYPFCPEAKNENTDSLQCSVPSVYFSQDTFSEKLGAFTSQKRFYSKRCPDPVFNATEGGYTSDLLTGAYEDQCPYFHACGLTSASTCKGSDSSFTFAGFIGTITELPPRATLSDRDALYHVTFNNGRTSYPFIKSLLELQVPHHNFELWFVQRTPYDFVIQQKKPFRVVDTFCAFDVGNDRYFPYVKLDEDGRVQTYYNVYDGVIDEVDYEDAERYNTGSGGGRKLRKSGKEVEEEAKRRHHEEKNREKNGVKEMLRKDKEERKIKADEALEKLKMLNLQDNKYASGKSKSKGSKSKDKSNAKPMLSSSTPIDSNGSDDVINLDEFEEHHHETLKEIREKNIQEEHRNLKGRKV